MSFIETLFSGTSSTQRYVDRTISVLSNNRVVNQLIYRKLCIKQNADFVKDIVVVNRNYGEVFCQ